MSKERLENDLELDPGIRETVRLLRSWDFNTTDSGDGKTKRPSSDRLPFPDVLPFPHVACVVEKPRQLASEARRMMAILKTEGIDFDSTEGPWIEASYSPIDGVAIIMLSNVDDELLRNIKRRGE